MLLAYLAPETLLPLTSIVAGLAGAILMFGRNLLRIATLLWQIVAGKPKRRMPIEKISRTPSRPKGIRYDIPSEAPTDRVPHQVDSEPAGHTLSSAQL